LFANADGVVLSDDAFRLHREHQSSSGPLELRKALAFCSAVTLKYNARSRIDWPLPAC
jgi:hypothetical protein